MSIIGVTSLGRGVAHIHIIRRLTVLTQYGVVSGGKSHTSELLGLDRPPQIVFGAGSNSMYLTLIIKLEFYANSGVE